MAPSLAGGQEVVWEDGEGGGGRTNHPELLLQPPEQQERQNGSLVSFFATAQRDAGPQVSHKRIPGSHLPCPLSIPPSSSSSSPSHGIRSASPKLPPLPAQQKLIPKRRRGGGGAGGSRVRASGFVVPSEGTQGTLLVAGAPVMACLLSARLACPRGVSASQPRHPSLLLPGGGDWAAGMGL